MRLSDYLILETTKTLTTLGVRIT
uniref:Uncharacterized protein n=1 Tax=Anguilla anguilla TaxID=7936 RepID=A0A0E9SHG8_ANGAN